MNKKSNYRSIFKPSSSSEKTSSQPTKRRVRYCEGELNFEHVNDVDAVFVSSFCAGWRTLQRISELKLSLAPIYFLHDGVALELPSRRI